MAQKKKSKSSLKSEATPQRWLAGMISQQMDLVGKDDDGNDVDRLGLADVAAKYNHPGVTINDLDSPIAGQFFRAHVINFVRQYVASNAVAIDFLAMAFHDADLFTKDVTDKDGNLLHSKGDVKPLHAHFLLHFVANNGKKRKTVEDAFYPEFNMRDGEGQTRNRHIETVKSDGGAILYLNHTFDATKTPYGLSNLALWSINHMPAKTHNGKVSKFKGTIYEDLGNTLSVKPTESRYWLTNLYPDGSLWIGGGKVGTTDEAREHNQSTPRIDADDQWGKLAQASGFKWHGSFKKFEKAEFMLKRQTGTATKSFLQERAKHDGIQNEDRPKDAKDGGSFLYAGKLPLKPGKHKDLTEIIQMVHDISTGLLNIADAQQVLVDDWGARGTNAYLDNKDKFMTAAGLFYKSLCNNEIANVKNGASKNCTSVFIHGAGGSGKDTIAKFIPSIINDERIKRRKKGQRRPSPKYFQAAPAGKKKTPDLGENWAGEEYAILSDVNGGNFNHHELTAMVDSDNRSPMISQRNSNGVFVPNYVIFTNFQSFYRFMYEMLESESRESRNEFCTRVEEGHGRLRFPALNDFPQTLNAIDQVIRRIPYYVDLQEDKTSFTDQTASIFIYVREFHSYVKVHEFKMARLSQLQGSEAIDAEAKRAAKIIVGFMVSYDWVGEFSGKREHVPYGRIAKYNTMYDVVHDSFKPLSLDVIKPRMLERWVKLELRQNVEIEDVHHLTSAQTLAFKIWLKTRIERLKSRLSKPSNNKAKMIADVFLGLLQDVETPLTKYDEEVEATQTAIDFVSRFARELKPEAVVDSRLVKLDYQTKQLSVQGKWIKNHCFVDSFHIDEPDVHFLMDNITMAGGPIDKLNNKQYWMKPGCGIGITMHNDQLNRVALLLRQYFYPHGFQFDAEFCKSVIPELMKHLENIKELHDVIVSNKLRPRWLLDLKDISKNYSSGGMINSNPFVNAQ